jgi:hypothetical protein
VCALNGCGSQQASATVDRVTAVVSDTPVGEGGASSKGPSAGVGAKPQAAVAPRPKLKPGARTKVLAKAGDRSYDKTFDDLRFEMTVGEKFVRAMLTKEIESLNGQKVRIRGYILPTPQKHGIQSFVLVRDNQECCFGPGAALYDCILIEMLPGTTADFTIRPIAVQGTFNIKEFVVDGKHLAIYQMAAESAK